MEKSRYLIHVFHVFTLSCLLWGCSLTSPLKNHGSQHDIGVISTAGTQGRLADHYGEATLIHFWATWCASCREEMSSLTRVAHEVPALSVVAIAVEDDPDAVAEFVRKHEIQFTVLLDQGEARATFSIPSLPYTVMLDNAGGRRKFLDPESGESVSAISEPRYWASTAAIQRVRASLEENGAP